MLTAWLQPPPRFHYERAQCVLANLFIPSVYYYICFYIIAEYVVWSWLMCSCRSWNEVSPEKTAEFDVLGCLAAQSQHTAADKTIQHQSGEQRSASCSALASSQKCVHAAHRSWAEAADTVRQVYSKIWGHTLHLTLNKTSAILSETGNKGNCYAAYEYKYTRSIAMKWTSVLFQRRTLNTSITCIVCVFVLAAVVPPVDPLYPLTSVKDMAPARGSGCISADSVLLLSVDFCLIGCRWHGARMLPEV